MSSAWCSGPPTAGGLPAGPCTAWEPKGRPREGLCFLRLAPTLSGKPCEVAVVPFPGWEADFLMGCCFPRVVHSPRIGPKNLDRSRQSREYWCAPRLWDPLQGTMLVQALALGGHRSSRRLAPHPQAWRLQTHLVRPSGRLTAKCPLLPDHPPVLTAVLVTLGVLPVGVNWQSPRDPSIPMAPCTGDPGQGPLLAHTQSPHL